MFGILRPRLADLNELDRREYKGTYCAMCHCLSANFGPYSRLLLYNDVVTLGWLFGAASVSTCGTATRNCLCFWRRKHIDGMSRFAKFAAAICVLMRTVKAEDDQRDGDMKFRWMRAIARLTKLCSPKALSLLAELGFPVDSIVRIVAESESLQRSGTIDLALASKPTASAYGIVAYRMAEYLGRRDCEQARRIGESLGSLVYAIDAALDYWDDRKAGSYNPLLNREASAANAELADLVRAHASEVSYQDTAPELARRWQAVTKSLVAILRAAGASISRKRALTRTELRKLYLRQPRPAFAFSAFPLGACFEQDCHGEWHLTETGAIAFAICAAAFCCGSCYYLAHRNSWPE